tara:strand:- start:205 stop:477 length:273 start_codon:yes stop_codon:yes gene_type:complete
MAKKDRKAKKKKANNIVDSRWDASGMIAEACIDAYLAGRQIFEGSHHEIPADASPESLFEDAKNRHLGWGSNARIRAAFFAGMNGEPRPE